MRRRHQFALSGLVHCGTCWDEGRRFLLVAELQKGRYVYYRCEECKRHQRAVFVREERLIAAHIATLTARFEGVLSASKEALGRGDGSSDDRRAEVDRLRAEHAALQTRLDVAYDDRLAGRIDTTYFDRRAAEWRATMDHLLDAIQRHDTRATSAEQAALELRQAIEILREATDPTDRRQVVQSVCSNSIWRDGELRVEWRQPSDSMQDFDRRE